MQAPVRQCEIKLIPHVYLDNERIVFEFGSFINIGIKSIHSHTPQSEGTNSLHSQTRDAQHVRKETPFMKMFKCMDHHFIIALLQNPK